MIVSCPMHGNPPSPHLLRVEARCLPLHPLLKLDEPGKKKKGCRSTIYGSERCCRPNSSLTNKRHRHPRAADPGRSGGCVLLSNRSSVEAQIFAGQQAFAFNCLCANVGERRGWSYCPNPGQGSSFSRRHACLRGRVRGVRGAPVRVACYCGNSLFISYFPYIPFHFHTNFCVCQAA